MGRSCCRRGDDSASNVLWSPPASRLSGSQYVPTEPVTDAYADHVTYAGRSVTVTQGANPPARLQRVLALLADILARRR